VNIFLRGCLLHSTKEMNAGDFFVWKLKKGENFLLLFSILSVVGNGVTNGYIFV
jgi:hypothetical protein